MRDVFDIAFGASWPEFLWKMGPWKTIFLYNQVVFHFHVSELEDMLPCSCSWHLPACSITQLGYHSNVSRYMVMSQHVKEPGWPCGQWLPG